uniref:Early E1A protein n=1 Tax=unclassified Simian adenoviruses TaxID=413684 RepID=Q64875_9ADEN|nr:E1A 21K protein [unclassified Simian adenoviruses]
MRHLALEMMSELLDLGLDTIDSWLHTEFAPVPTGVSHNMSLHEMYDLDVTGQEDENEEAVDGVFSDAMLLAAEEGVEMPSLYSPGPLVGGGEMPELQPEEVDLFCYEDGFPPSDSEEGPVSDSEPDEPDSTTADSNHGSPPTLRCTPPRDLPRPVPVKASHGKRPAVNSLHDLIEEVEQTVPLDLSLKRSRSN